ncbi:MAG: hypothetical protein V2A54_15405 [Bacteroidota bacterium]
MDVRCGMPDMAVIVGRPQTEDRKGVEVARQKREEVTGNHGCLVWAGCLMRDARYGCNGRKTAD